MCWCWTLLLFGAVTHLNAHPAVTCLNDQFVENNIVIPCDVHWTKLETGRSSQIICMIHKRNLSVVVFYLSSRLLSSFIARIHWIFVWFRRWSSFSNEMHSIHLSCSDFKLSRQSITWSVMKQMRSLFDAAPSPPPSLWKARRKVQTTHTYCKRCVGGLPKRNQQKSAHKKT